MLAVEELEESERAETAVQTVVRTLGRAVALAKAEKTMAGYPAATKTDV